MNKPVTLKSLDVSRFSLNLVGSLVAFAAALAFLVQAPIGQSFSLDETITMWVTDGSLESAIERAWKYQGQSPLYFILMWILRQMIGSTETALRASSLVIMTLVAIPLIDCARTLKLRHAWTFVPLVLLSDPLILRYSIMIRPYALALLCAACACAMLLRWMRSGERRYLVAYSISFSLTLYFQYLFGPLAIIHLLTYVLLRKDLGKGRFLHLMTAWAASSLLLLPGVLHILYWLPKRSMLSAWSNPTFKQLIKNIIPLEILAFAGLGLVFGLLYVPVKLVKGDKRLLVLFVVAALFPTISLFILSQLGEGTYFVDRYYLWRTLGLALLVTFVFNHFEGQQLQKLSVMIWGLFLITLNCLRVFHLDDWKGMQTELSRRSELLPVLFHSGLIELNSPPYPDDPLAQQYLRTPLRVYPLKQPSILIPAHFETESRNLLLTQQVLPKLEEHNSFVVATVQGPPVPFNNKRLKTAEYFSELFSLYDFELVEERHRGLVCVLFFRRTLR
jgi:hypothetical protein